MTTLMDHTPAADADVWALIEAEGFGGGGSTLEQRKAYLKRKLRIRYKRLLAMPEWTVDELAELDDRLQDYVIQGVRMKALIQKRIAW